MDGFTWDGTHESAMNQPAERPLVRAASIRLPDGRVVEGLNHFDARMNAGLSDEDFYRSLDAGEIEEGFTSHDGVFLSREQAEQLAIEAEQLPIDQISGFLTAEQVESMNQPAPPMEGDRVIISDDLAGDVTLAGWENVEITLDTGRIINTHHMHLEPHPATHTHEARYDEEDQDLL